MPATPSRKPYRQNGTPWNDARIEAGLSIRDLHARTGIPRSTLTLIDQGRLTPTPAQAGAIIRALFARDLGATS